MSEVPTQQKPRPTRGMLARLFPFLVWGRNLNRQTLRGDLMAGLTGAVIGLPQAVAYALIAGLPPAYGLYGAIFTGAVASLFGSSRLMISGPAAAISILVFGVVSQHAVPGTAEYITDMLVLTFMVGVIQLVLGLARLGALVTFISHAVVVGFTAGAAALIVTSQLKYVIGLTLPGSDSFVTNLTAVVTHLGEANAYALLVAGTTLGVYLLSKWLRPRWPAMLLAMAASGTVCYGIGGPAHGIAMVGALPAGLPVPTLPDLSLDRLQSLLSGAFAVALLCLVEAVSIARALAARAHERLDGNQEFIGQGLSNVVGSLMSCYPGSGSFTRSGANIDAGARTPLAGVLWSVFIALVVLLLPGATAFLPMPAMGAIILVIGWNLVDWEGIRKVAKASRPELAVLATTAVATLAMGLEFAVYAGVLFSLFQYLYRTSRPRLVPVSPRPDREGMQLRNAPKHGLVECPQLKILRLDGSLYFGAVDNVDEALQGMAGAPPAPNHLLIVGSATNFVDVSGAELLAKEAHRLAAAGGGLYVSAMKDPSLDVVRRGGYFEEIGPDHFFRSPEQAVADIVLRRLDHVRCARCPHYVFNECAEAKLLGGGSSSTDVGRQ